MSLKHSNTMYQKYLGHVYWTFCLPLPCPTGWQKRPSLVRLLSALRFRGVSREGCSLIFRPSHPLSRGFFFFFFFKHLVPGHTRDKITNPLQAAEILVLLT